VPTMRSWIEDRIETLPAGFRTEVRSPSHPAVSRTDFATLRDSRTRRTASTSRDRRHAAICQRQPKTDQLAVPRPVQVQMPSTRLG
jgi:hypothetical protein